FRSERVKKMNEYQEMVIDELDVWKKKMFKKSSILNRISKNAQTKVNGLIPEKAHNIITDAIKNMVKATLVGSNVTTSKTQAVGYSLYERDRLLKDKLSTYRKTAVVEGAGTGAGGILL